ncbi:hypothetical protein [Clostridium sp.]
MVKITNYVMIYFMCTIPFLFLLYYVIKRAIKDGLLEYDKVKNKK